MEKLEFKVGDVAYFIDRDDMTIESSRLESITQTKDGYEYKFENGGVYENPTEFAVTVDALIKSLLEQLNVETNYGIIDGKIVTYFNEKKATGRYEETVGHSEDNVVLSEEAQDIIDNFINSITKSY